MIECSRCKIDPAIIAFDGDERNILCAACAREQLYAKCVTTPSDINEHLPLLRALAKDCEKVIEFGTRWGRGSTVAFLAAQPKQFITWDLDPEMTLHQRLLDLSRIQGGTFFQPRVGNTLDIPVERCDLLFLDSLHTKDQLLGELVRHADPGSTPERSPTSRPVRKYLVFHDTVTFGRIGEDGKEPGIYAAIRHYQRNHAFPLWEVMPLAQVKHLDADNRARIAANADLRRDGEPILNLSNNNGLVVLKYICADGHGRLTVGKQCHDCGEWT